MLDDFLYRNPELYESIYPHRRKAELCKEAFDKHLSRPPASLLEVACGTGRDLFDLSKGIPDCAGFDVEPKMVAFARERNPGLEITAGDMRSCRLNRTFDAICALGGSINFALSNDELDQTIETYRTHAHPGTLLFLQTLNSGEFFGQFKAPTTFSGSYGGTRAEGIASYKLFAMEQLVERERVWRIDGESGELRDLVRFRIIFPAELSHFLAVHGFEVLEIMERPGGNLYTMSMFVVARFDGR